MGFTLGEKKKLLKDRVFRVPRSFGCFTSAFVRENCLLAMSLAALASYASDSDDASESGTESPAPIADNPSTPRIVLPEKPSTSRALPEDVQNPRYGGVDNIEDDDEFVLTDHAPEFPEAALLFASLPAPRAEDSVAEEDLTDIVPVETAKPKKRQIVLPKLSDFTDNDGDAEKPKPKVLRSSAGSGLMALLPKPSAWKTAVGNKTSLTQLTPHSLGKRPTVPKSVPPVPEKKARPTIESSADAAEDEEAGPSTSSFFSFEEPKLSDEQIRDLLKKEDLAPRRKRDLSPEIVGPSAPVPPCGPTVELPSSTAFTDPGPQQMSSSADDLPEEVLHQLRGRRKETVEMLSINAEDFAAEARSNLLKNITVEDTHPVSTEGEPTRLHKSKHHITHLAFIAKARENELKNQWSANRMTKRETQQKYGF